MKLECLHYNTTLEDCGVDWQRCAQRIQCPEDKEQHCFAVYDTDQVHVKNAGCNDHEHEKCGTECIGKKRGRGLHYCCCIEDNCNNKYIPYVEPPTTPSALPQPPPQIAPQMVTSTNNAPWFLIVVIFVLTGLIIATFIKRKSLKRAAGLVHHVEAGQTNGQGSNNINGSKIHNNNNHPHHHNTNQTTVNNINNNIMSNASELDEMNIGRDVIIPIQVTTTTNINATTLNDPASSNPPGSTQQYYSQVDLKDIKLLKNVGNGRFGTVYMACIERNLRHNRDTNNDGNDHDNREEEEQQQDNQDRINPLNDNENTTLMLGDIKINLRDPIAVKVIPSSENQSWQNELKIFSLPQVRHPNVLVFLGSCHHVESDSYWLLVEYAGKGSLHHYLKENIVNWEQFLQISLGIVRGLAHLHDANVAHRDFKSKNVLLKPDLTPCVTDFGVASIVNDSCGTKVEQRRKLLQVGTPRYMAPEVLECSVIFSKSSITKIDVYALSLVLWELMYRCWPLPKLEYYDGQDNLPEPTDYFAIPPGQGSFNQQGHALSSNPDDDLNDEQTNLLTGDSINPPGPTPYMMPFENVVGSNPDINSMRQIVICDKLRPPIKQEWYYFPLSKVCKSIIAGWEYDHDARITASCFVERIEDIQHC